MDYNTENIIIQIVKKHPGRPKRVTPLTDEEKKTESKGYC